MDHNAIFFCCCCCRHHLEQPLLLPAIQHLEAASAILRRLLCVRMPPQSCSGLTHAVHVLLVDRGQRPLRLRRQPRRQHRGRRPRPRREQRLPQGGGGRGGGGRGASSSSSPLLVWPAVQLQRHPGRVLLLAITIVTIVVSRAGDGVVSCGADRVRKAG